MKHAGSIFVAVLAFIQPPAQAAEFTVEDVSNRIIACSDTHSFLATLSPQSPPGAVCTVEPPSTLSLVITTMPDELPLRCIGKYCAPAYDVYFVAHHADRLFIYDPQLIRTGPSPFPRKILWQPLPEDISGVKPSVSWTPPPFSGGDDRIEYSHHVKLLLDDTANGYPSIMPMSELEEIHVAITPAGQKLFAPGWVKQIWPLPRQTSP